MKVLFNGSGQYPEGTPIGPRCWPHHDLIVVTKGCISLSIATRSVELSEGDAVLIPPQVHFIGEGRTADAAIWVLHVKADRSDDLYGLLSARRPRIFRDGVADTFASVLLSELTILWRSNPRRNERMYLVSLARTLLAKLYQSNNTPLQMRQRKNRLMPCRIDELSRQGVSGLARESGFCKSHYRALFREAFGETPRSYLRKARIKQACHLLHETMMPIKDIASRVGYGDTVAFHRAFCRLTGTTPARYRKTSTTAA